jgi:single-strand DNA-binding protein
MNNVDLIARITSDLELQTTTNGTSLCKFSVAYNEKYNGQEHAHFFNCTAFGKSAEFVVNYCKKGGRVGVFGKLVQNRWETKEGQKRSSVEIMVREVSPIDWKDSENVQERPVTNQPENNPFSDKDIPF